MDNTSKFQRRKLYFEEDIPLSFTKNNSAITAVLTKTVLLIALTLTTSVGVFASEAEIKQQSYTATYTVAKDGSLSDSEKCTLAVGNEAGFCYVDGEAYTGEIEIEGAMHRYNNGLPASYYVNGDSVSYYDPQGKKEERPDLDAAVDMFMQHYNDNTVCETPVYSTGNIRDLFMLINTIGELTGNDIVKGSLYDIMESKVIDEEMDGRNISVYELYMTDNMDALQEYKKDVADTDAFLQEADLTFEGTEDAFEVCRRANTFIRSRYSYDYGKASTVESGNPNTSTIIDLTTDENTIICDDYAKLFEFLCNRYGVETDYVTGFSSSGGSHAWNRSIIDGKEYYTDVTWNDTGGGNQWLLLNRDTFYRDHVDLTY